MSYAKEREQFIAAMVAEGLPYDVVCVVLRNATTIQRCGELACSSEAADRDRVPCPGVKGKECLCDAMGEGKHERVPRIAVREMNARNRIHGILRDHAGFEAVFQGDPRGACVLLHVPSGRTDDWGRSGMCVPARVN
jgi:hypothetical protein